MAEPGQPVHPGQRPAKRAKAAIVERGPDLQADALLKYHLKLPQDFTPGSIQANRVALRVDGTSCKAYVANAQYVYEVSLGLDLEEASLVPDGAVDRGKEGVLVPHSTQADHIRQLDALSPFAAEVQDMYAGTHGRHHVLAAVDAVGNVRLMASTLRSKEPGPQPGALAGGEGDEGHERHVMALEAQSRGECGWCGLAVRDLGDGADGGGPPQLEVAVARQRQRDVRVFRDGALLRTIHTMQGPTALTYLPPGNFGGCAEASGGLLAVAEEHQVVLWDVRQGERGGCVQRLGVYGGGWPLYRLSWVAGVNPRQQAGGGEGLLAATGGERSVVMLEPRKWHVVAKWPGCVKYPATHLAPSAVAPGFVYVAGLDYECTAGRWDGSCGGSSGNANSSSGGHGRAMGPPQLLAGQRDAAAPALMAAADDGPEAGSRGGLSFRGDSKWLGLAAVQVPSAAVTRATGAGSSCRELVAALSLSGHLFLLGTRASEVACVGAD